MVSGDFQFVFFRYLASLLFILSHSLLVLDHIPFGAVLHGIGEVFIALGLLRKELGILYLLQFYFSSLIFGDL